MYSATNEFLWGCPQAIARGRAFHYYSGTGPVHNTFTGVTVSIPHPKVQVRISLQAACRTILLKNRFTLL